MSTLVTTSAPAGSHQSAPGRPGRIRTCRARAGRLLSALLLVLLSVTLADGRAEAAPAPTPAPSSPVTDAVCAAKGPGSDLVAWCMSWAVRVDAPVPGGRSHWITQCSRAASAADRRSCAAASITLEPNPPDGVASVLMDGPSTGAGPTGLINCGLQTPPGGLDQNPQSPWTGKRLACQAEASAWAAQLYDPDPKQPDCPATDVSCKVERGAQDALSAGISTGIQGLVDIMVQGTVFLLSKLATWVFTVTSISTPDQAFYNSYNSLAGVLVVLIFVFFIVSTIINGLRTSTGPGPLSTLGGLVRAVLGVTFAGGIAYTVVAAWDQATNAVIEANARTSSDPSRLVTVFTDLTGGAGTLFIAAVLSLLATVGLLLLFVIMLFRGLLTTAAALFGAMAMTGQVMGETRHWARRWFWTVNALGSSKFFIAQFWIYGSRSAYESDDVMNALRAVLLIWLMVAAPWILLRLTTMWDGYLADVNAHAMVSSAGNPLLLGADFVDGARAGAGGAGGPDTSPGAGAAGLMDENTAGVASTPGATAAGIGEGTGRQAADAASTSADGGKVGEPATPTAAGEGRTDADDANRQEADGIQAGAHSAAKGVSNGQLTAPGDTGGEQGSLPLTPAGAQTADPSGGILPQPADTGAESADEGVGGGQATGGARAAGGASSGRAAAAADVPVIPI